MFVCPSPHLLQMLSELTNFSLLSLGSRESVDYKTVCLVLCICVSTEVSLKDIPSEKQSVISLFPITEVLQPGITKREPSMVNCPFSQRPFKEKQHWRKGNPYNVMDNVLPCKVYFTVMMQEALSFRGHERKQISGRSTICWWTTIYYLESLQ